MTKHFWRRNLFRKLLDERFVLCGKNVGCYWLPCVLERKTLNVRIIPDISEALFLSTHITRGWRLDAYIIVSKMKADRTTSILQRLSESPSRYLHSVQLERTGARRASEGRREMVNALADNFWSLLFGTDCSIAMDEGFYASANPRRCRTVGGCECYRRFGRQLRITLYA